MVSGIMTVVTALLTINFVKDEGLKSNLKSGEGFSLLDLDLELVAEQRA